MKKKVLAGKFEVLERFGSTSLGTIYRCRHRELDRREVFVNVLYDELAADSGASESVRDVVVRMMEIRHPNFITVYEYLREEELVLFSTEAIPGMLLSDYIDEQSPVSQDTVVEILCDVLRAVEEIHKAGVVHRALMPEGVIVLSDGTAKVWSLPVPNLVVAPKLSDEGPGAGYLDCAAPECIEIGQLDERSDIYALGVIAYELITGSRPFNGKGVVDSLTMRLSTTPASPEQVRSDCLPELSEITMKALSRYAEDRYQSAREMREDLERRVLARH